MADAPPPNDTEARVLHRAGLLDAAPAGGHAEESVSAAFVEALFAGRYGLPADPGEGLTLAGVNITGDVRLRPHERLRGTALAFSDCRLEGAIDAAGLRATSLTLRRCSFAGLDVSGADLEEWRVAECRLGRGAAGANRIVASGLAARRVTIAGLVVQGLGATLLLDEARLEALDLDETAAGRSGETLAMTGSRLHCDRLRLARGTLTSVALRELVATHVQLLALRAAGHVDLTDSEARSVEVSGCELGGALRLDRARVAGNVRLVGSRIGTGKLALGADHASIGGTLLLADDPETAAPFVASGAVRLRASDVEQIAITGRIEPLGGLDLSRARIEALVLHEGASVAGIGLDRATLGTLQFEAGTELTAPVRGRRLHVAGPVAIGARFACAGDVAIDLSSGTFDDRLHFAPSFRCEGRIRLDYCHVAGDVVFTGEVRAPALNALDVAGLESERLMIAFDTLEGGVSFRRSACSSLTLRGHYYCPRELPLHLGVQCRGRIAIGEPGHVTHVSGTLSLIDATCRELLVRALSIRAPIAGRWAGRALAARHLSVETLARIGHGEEAAGISADGSLAFDYATFGDDLRLIGLAVAGLSLRSVSVRGDLVLGEPGAPVAAGGLVDLAALKVGGDTKLDALQLLDGAGAPVVDAAGAEIGGTLHVGRIETARAWHVNLEDAAVETLDDRHGSAWRPAAGPPPTLAIATFRYQRLADLGAGSAMGHEEAVAARLGWIAAHATPNEPRFFRATPYHTLASILDAGGDAAGVKTVEVASRRAKRHSGAQPRWVRAADWLFDVTSGYGYAPERALTAMLVYFLIGWGGVTLADRQGAFEPAPTVEGGAAAAALARDPHGCAWMEDPLYALDVMLPVVSLGQEDVCSIRAERHDWSWARSIYRLIGSVLVSVALLTFSGLLKRDD